MSVSPGGPVGPWIHAFEVKVLAYADDVTFFCGTVGSVHRALCHVRRFCDASGARVSWTKCSGSWLGQWQSQPTSLANLSWSTEAPKYLGIVLNHAQVSGPFWTSFLSRLRQVVSAWKPLNFSIFGRAYIANTFLASCVSYYLQVLPCTRTHISRSQRSIYTFIRNSTY
ncbi:reverse transcriptase domain-containing protein [Bradyrhizobium sp. 33ap4]|uniref:reverse transcriptase domain-containing protein n=1 Tax=Bradyrhizobium sp. 33ap4 TaxID=3061630 RepID=UPI003977760D